MDTTRLTWLEEVADLVDRTAEVLDQQAAITLLERLEATSDADEVDHDHVAILLGALADRVTDPLLATYCRLGRIRQILRGRPDDSTISRPAVVHDGDHVPDGVTPAGQVSFPPLKLAPQPPHPPASA